MNGGIVQLRMTCAVGGVRGWEWREEECSGYSEMVEGKGRERELEEGGCGT